MTTASTNGADQTMSMREADVLATLESLVLHQEYPCLGARSVFTRERATVRVFESLGGEESATRLIEGLREFAERIDPTEGFASFVAVFRGPQDLDEREFEQLLWRELEVIHEADGTAWNPDVSSDPDNPHFAFSVAGTAFFVVGLHPHASRIARRTPWPTLVFNLHEQFEELRASGQFERMRDTIRRRDEQLQGSINPMVEDHGSGSEARQYSGRSVPDDWSAPFDPAEAQA